ncbi:putative pinE invertase/site-specific DNA recombinase [Escherichia coli]|uniref:Putative pinE invertase/site-specific DNA recombinase n=1 Tax=Escherichia coli TaxID=562 RepID=A0A376KSM6_ECOLX|nr:putative pinE invertase/site-specific DNA recombinase [Escherichia coli]
MLIGYVRVSTNDQNTDLQRNALNCAGCELIFLRVNHQHETNNLASNLILYPALGMFKRGYCPNPNKLLLNYEGRICSFPFRLKLPVSLSKKSRSKHIRNNLKSYLSNVESRSHVVCKNVPRLADGRSIARV